jgi:Fe-S-cluster containining protein
VRWRRAGRDELERSLVPGHFSLQGLDVRADGRCIHQGTSESPLDCSIHAIRPNTCRDFAAGSNECLAVRRRGGRE